MIYKKYLKINDAYLINRNISNKKLNESISFIQNQTGLEKNLIEKLLKRNIKISIPLLNQHNDEIDIIIKTKINKNYKYINLTKGKIFYKLSNTSDISSNKIKRYELNKIKFFPKTYVRGSLVYQNLAKGSFYIPNKLSDINLSLLNSIGTIVNHLSRKNQNFINVSNYIDKFEKANFDNFNQYIINCCLLFLKKFQFQEIKISLTHGDFKYEHLYLLNKNLEYVIDWENVGERSVYFDIFNFFVPWFVKRNHNYLEIKEYVSKFIEKHLLNLNQNFNQNYNLYFAIYALERYQRIIDSFSNKTDYEAAFKRYNSLFKNIINQINLSK